MYTHVKHAKAKMNPKMRIARSITTRIIPLRCCISWFVHVENLHVCNDVTQKTIIKSPETQIKNHVFSCNMYKFDLDLVEHKKWIRNDHVVQLSIFIVQTEDICPEHSQKLHGMSLKFTQNILKIWQQSTLNLLGSSWVWPTSPQ